LRKLDETSRERLKEVARKISRTPYWLIKQAIFSYLETLESGTRLPELARSRSAAAKATSTCRTH